MTRRGFTLIELMIVIAIVGILAAIAIPAYEDYTIKARVVEGLNLASTAKMAVSETAMMNRSLPNDQAETGYTSPAATDNVQSISIGDGGVITIQYTSAAGGGTLLLKPKLFKKSGEITWDCKKGSLEKKYRPANCR